MNDFFPFETFDRFSWSGQSYLFIRIVMAKISRKQKKKTGNSRSTESQSVVQEDDVQITSQSNGTGSGRSDGVDGDDQNASVQFESKVWKFATKVSADKARCNICSIGKIKIEILDNVHRSVVHRLCSSIY